MKVSDLKLFEILYAAFIEITHDVGHFARLSYRRIIILITRDIDHEFLKKDGSAKLIVFIHGYLGDRKNFISMRNDLKEHGNHLYVSYNTLQDIRDSAEAIQRVIDFYLEQNPHIQEVGLVCHSMGGLVGTELIYHVDTGRAYRFCITLGTPFRGTELAHVGFCPSVHQMKPDSPFIHTLWQSIHTKPKTEHFSLRAAKDQIVRTSYLECGVTETLPTTHLGLLRDPIARNKVKEWIETCA